MLVTTRSSLLPPGVVVPRRAFVYSLRRRSTTYQCYCVVYEVRLASSKLACLRGALHRLDVLQND